MWALGACTPVWLHQTRESIREGALRLSEADLHDARTALLALKPIEDEQFGDFLPRARAALVASSNRKLQALAYEIPDDPGLSLSPAIVEAMPVVVARWARLRGQSARREALVALLRLPTVLPPVPGEEALGAHESRRAFEAFRDQLKALALAGDLRYRMVADQAWVLHLQPERVQPGLVVERLPPPITVLTHADVASASSFEPVVTRESITGPGVLDDKGPIIAAASALAALQQSRLWLRRSATLVVGRSWAASGEGLDAYMARLATRKVRDVLVADGPFSVGVGPPPRNEKLILAVLAARRLVRGEAEEPFVPVELAEQGGDVHWAAAVPGAVTFWPLEQPASAPAHTLTLEALDDLVEAYAFAIAKLGM